MEGLEKNNLSFEQQAKLDVFSEEITPLIQALLDSNDSTVADEIEELTNEFKASLVEEEINMPDKYIDNLVKIITDMERSKLKKAA